MPYFLVAFVASIVVSGCAEKRPAVADDKASSASKPAEQVQPE
jgi:hypothetical protein